MSLTTKYDLINILKEEGIESEKILNAFLEVNREDFVPPIAKEHAWENVALPIGGGQTISQPFTVAFMTSALNVKPDEKVLEIGTGSGYQAAILYTLGAKVYSVERNLEIYNRTLRLFDVLPYKAMMRYGDGTIGWNDFAPYDKIIVTAGGPSVPKSLLKQLKVGGRLVIPIGNKQEQEMRVIDKISEEEYKTQTFPHFSFVPLIGMQGWKNE